jgi:hypothetical protein
MAAGRYSFTIEQGTTFQLELIYKDSNQTPVDLTGYSGRMQLRPTVDSTTVYLTLSSSLRADGTGLNFSGSNGSTPPTSGSIGIYIASCTSSLLTFTTAKYDLEIYSGSGACPLTVRLLEGQISLSNQVTV